MDYTSIRWYRVQILLFISLKPRRPAFYDHKGFEVVGMLGEIEVLIDTLEISKVDVRCQNICVQICIRKTEWIR